MNLLALQTEVLARGFDPAQYGSRIVQWLNDAQSLVARRVDYYIDEATDPFTTVAGTSVYSMPANFARMRSLFDSNRHVDMEYVSIRDIDDSTLVTAPPLFYALYGGSLQLYPTPDAIYNLTMRYWLLPAALVADDDTPTIPADWHHLLWVYATWMAFEADDDAQMGQYWQQRFNTELSMFTADQKFPDTDGPTQARGMWDSRPGLNRGNSWSLFGGF